MRVFVGVAALAGCADPSAEGEADDEVGSSETSGDASTGESETDASSTSDATSETSTSESADDTTGESGDGDGDPNPYPEPDAWGPLTGPGGPSVTFTPDQLYVNCAFLDGGVDDTTDHHNLVVMFDGFLMMPWAPEWGGGGITFFDISDPCNPEAVGYGTSDKMRETHASGFFELEGEWYAVVDGISQPLLGLEGGIQIWRVSDPGNPEPVSNLHLPGFLYPDSYSRVTLSVFVQYPWVFVGGADNGVYVADISDPANPTMAAQKTFNPTHRVGQVQVVGNLLLASAAEGPRNVFLDVSIPNGPQPIAGGDFSIVDSLGQPRESYFSNWSGGYGFYAIKDGGGGVLIWDLHDPGNPQFHAENKSGGNGGYVFARDSSLAFVGESDIARIYDWSNPDEVTIVAELDLEGDLDTITPIGNIAVLSCDDESVANQGSALAPWQTEPDSQPPIVDYVWPADGASEVKLTSRIGIGFSEMVEPRSVFAGSVRLYETGTDPALTRVDGFLSIQEHIVSFAPATLLDPGTQYTLEIPAGGVVDYNGNPVAETFTSTFTSFGG
ncbi:Ig-like domain-containing protein [Nannocystaceae bacterium ST9]